MSSNFLLDDKFTVTAINKDGKYYERVNRIDAKSEIYEIQMQLDINSEIFPMEKNKDYSVVITKSINNDSEDKGNIKAYYNAEELGKSSLLDEYQYAMYGKVFKVTEGKNNEMTVCASFGGLLMSLKGKPQHLKNMLNDIRIYLLIKAAV